MKKNVPVEQMLKYLGYEKLTREMLEEYVQNKVSLKYEKYKIFTTAIRSGMI